MDSSSRNQMPAPSKQQSSREPTPEPASASNTLSARSGSTNAPKCGNLHDVRWLCHDHCPDADASSPSRRSPYSLERSASFRDGTWHGYDLTHDLIDPWFHVVFGEPTRPPMDKNDHFEFPATMQPPSHGLLPPLEPTQFSCTLPVPTVPPPILTPPCLGHSRALGY